MQFLPATLLSLLSLLSFLTFRASASPVAHTKRRVDTSSHCGLWDSVKAGKYELGLNQWGAHAASNGSQCAAITSAGVGNTIAWQTTYDWAGGKGVKSFTNIQLNDGINKQLSEIKSMPAQWSWSMSTTSAVADVAFDLFTGGSAGGSYVNELMIWLANFNAGPISSKRNRDGTPIAAAANVSIAGHRWNLYTGSNGYNNVFSFLPVSGTIPDFSGDIYAFVKYLTKHGDIASSQYLITAQAGTEAFNGSATLTTSSYSLSIS